MVSETEFWMREWSYLWMLQSGWCTICERPASIITVGSCHVPGDDWISVNPWMGLWQDVWARQHWLRGGELQWP